MDTSDGRIFAPEQMGILKKIFDNQLNGNALESAFRELNIAKKDLPKKEDLKEMQISPTKKQMKTRKVGRNDPCPCGSGKKFKKCCLK